MRKIGIDARLYDQTGIGIYLKNLLYYLEKEAPDDFSFYVYLLEKDSRKINFKRKNFIKRKVNYLWHSFCEQIGFAKILYQDNLDLVHFTYFSYPVFYRKRFIATVHDLTPLVFKTGRASLKNPLIYSLKHLAFRFVLSSQIKYAKAIITPTFSIKNDLVKIFGEQYKNKTFSLYEGVDYRLRLVDHFNDCSFFHNKRENFFIYVGNFYPHKNVERLIKAFLGIKEDIKLFLLGPNDFFARRLPSCRKVKFYFNPTLSDLVYFYRHALALIHPSLSEGFGLPLVEAAYFGCPVIASNIPVFKEILGDQFISFNPKSVDDIKDKINFFLREKPKFNYRSVLKKFSFEQMTKETLKIYFSCI